MACYKAANLRWPCYPDFRSLELDANCSAHPNQFSSGTGGGAGVGGSNPTTDGDICGGLGGGAAAGVSAVATGAPLVCKRCKKYLSLLTALRQARTCGVGEHGGGGGCGCCDDDLLREAAAAPQTSPGAAASAGRRVQDTSPAEAKRSSDGIEMSSRSRARRAVNGWVPTRCCRHYCGYSCDCCSSITEVQGASQQQQGSCTQHRARKGSTCTAAGTMSGGDTRSSDTGRLRHMAGCAVM